MWTGDFFHSVAGAFNADIETLNTISKYTIKYDNKCKETVWSFFYKDDYMESLKEYNQRMLEKERELERKHLEEKRKQLEQQHRSYEIKSLTIE